MREDEDGEDEDGEDEDARVRMRKRMRECEGR